jgi:squalene-associated FAD-dependent desaturase
MPFETVIVIGGGLAGLSSAVALAESGLRVCVLEKRPHLGGRAASYVLPDGSHIDNCQHITLGCCTNLEDFYQRVGAGGKIRYYDRLFFADGQGRRSVIAPSNLPPPLHLAPAFLRFAALKWNDKRGIARALFRIAVHGGQVPEASGISMLQWLQQQKQTPPAIARFWSVVLVSALDEELGRTDARYGIDVFWKAFLSSKRGGRFGIPTVPLGDLYQGCRTAIERRGGEVRSRAVVREIRATDNRFDCVILDDGTELRADACISAVPHDVLLATLPESVVEQSSALKNLRRLRYSPITGVHLWFERPVMQEPYLAFLDQTVQWIFNKTLLYDAATGFGNDPSAGDGAGAPGGQYLQLVISASYGLVSKSRQEILDLCLSDLKNVLPAARTTKLLKGTVVKEVAATFSPEPGSDSWRPGAQSPVARLWLAGDWTRTGWPATMEGAVRSGYIAAEALLAASGQSQTFLRPDLPAEGLCRLWERPPASPAGTG